MIRSMTAFAKARTASEGFNVGSEIRTYNSRYLDVTVKLPAVYRHYENSLKQLVSCHIERGRVELTVNIRDERDRPCGGYAVDTAKAAEYHRALVRLKESLGMEEEIPLDLVARIEGVIVPLEPDAPGEFEWTCIRKTMEAAFRELNDMREKEGAFLAADLSARIGALDDMVRFIRKQSADLMEAYYQQIKERISGLIGDMVEIDASRIAQEAAFYVDKADISEEIVRAESHIEQFRQAMGDDSSCGRKLNFLLQEFNREFNTMGAKSGDVAVSEKVVAAKIELEKLREQVQNVE